MKYKCNLCGKEFDNPGSLGGHTSAAHSQKWRKSVSKALTKETIFVKRECGKCGNLFDVEAKLNKDGSINFRTSRRFCSKTCSHSRTNSGPKAKKREPTLQQFRNEAIRDKNWDKITELCGKRTIRKIVIQEQEGKCLMCGISSWRNNPISLQVDHIDGNFKNNKRSNLRALCPNCHSQTETWGSRNKRMV